MKRKDFRLTSIYDDPEAVEKFVEFIDSVKASPVKLSDYLNRKLEEKGLSQPEVCRRADMDRQLLNRLAQVGSDARACKETLMRIAIGMTATENEANELLDTCGFKFEMSKAKDLAYLFCIRNGYYNIYYVYDIVEMIKEKEQDRKL